VDDIFVHELQLPMCIHATTIPDNNGDFTIILNSLLSPRVKKEALEHELVHIKMNHFYNDCLEIADEEMEANDCDNHVKVSSCICEIR
jgi:hypothetical protein